MIAKLSMMDFPIGCRVPSGVLGRSVRNPNSFSMFKCIKVARKIGLQTRDKVKSLNNPSRIARARVDFFLNR